MTETQKTRARIERALEVALRPGEYIKHDFTYKFVRGLDLVEEEVAAQIEHSPGLAVELYETLIAACHEKIEEIDDSGADLGMFCARLFPAWVRARAAAGAPPEETAARLAAWMDDDPYGLCSDIARDVPPTMDEAHLAAFARVARGRLTDLAGQEQRPSTSHARTWSHALKHILTAQGDVNAFVALCEASGRLTAEDCEVVAAIHEEAARPEEALVWVERGLGTCGEGGYDSACHGLEHKRRKLLQQLGRGDEALEQAWTEFDQYPSAFSFEELMKYVDEEHEGEWRERVLSRGETAELGDAFDLFIAADALDRLASRVERASDAELEAQGHSSSGRAGDALRESHPVQAARLYRAAAVRILNLGKSKYYDEILKGLARARDCLRAAGQESTWQQLVAELRSEHGRKRSFVAGLERIVAGSAVVERPPSFLERARKRWSR